jgi:hypothetical protein
MATHHDQLLKADQYYVLVVHAKPGMGFEAGQALVDKAQSKTFGSTITQLAKAKQLPQEVEARFQTVLKERNWLVHGSRSSSRNAIHDDQACNLRMPATAGAAREPNRQYLGARPA